jgi:hypothetical protein
VGEQQFEDVVACAVAQTQPNQFGRRAQQEAALIKVRVFGNKRKPIGAGVFQDGLIGLAFQPAIPDVAAAGKTGCRSGEAILARGSRQKAASWNDDHAPLTVGGEGKARLYILGAQIRKILQHIGHRNSRAANAWLAAANKRVNGNAITIIHVVKVRFDAVAVKFACASLRERTAPSTGQ